MKEWAVTIRISPLREGRSWRTLTVHVSANTVVEAMTKVKRDHQRQGWTVDENIVASEIEPITGKLKGVEDGHS